MFTFDNNDYSNQQQYMLRDLVEGMGYEMGLDTYPIFDEAYRPKLNAAIYGHFMFRRIASETPAKFLFYLNRYMTENMPTYNVIYKKVREEHFDPLATSQRYDSGSSKSSNESSSNSETNGDGKTIVSDTPQVYLEDPLSLNYMNAINHSLTEGKGKDSALGKNDSSFESMAKSTDGGYGAVIYDMMASGFMATDTLVFQMLEPLFMNLFDDQPR